MSKLSKSPNRQSSAPAKTPAQRNRGSATQRSANAPSSSPSTKSEIILGMLRRKGGATIVDLSHATGWLPHSVRGFLSGTLKKKRGLTVLVDKSSGATRYRLATAKG